MSKRNILTIVGFLLFLIGFVGIIVNLIGLPFAITDWVYAIIGTTAGFFFKLLLIIVGIVLTVVANSKTGNEETYDEYFDGDAFN